MKVFDAYAKYYDLLYRDKDYVGEAAFTDEVVRRYCPEAGGLLDLGCGTGKHAAQFARLGYRVTGVDQSERMITAAREHTEAVSASAGSCEFFQGDIRTVRIGETFDVVVALFHVMSYQASNEDLRQAMETAKAHLAPGGIFIFDCWYGPAVLTDPPEQRSKQLEDESIKVTRTAEPVLRANDNLVDVNYRVSITEKQSNRVEELHETHTMRYLFMPELRQGLSLCGLELVACKAWLSDDEPGIGSWNVYFVAANQPGVT